MTYVTKRLLPCILLTMLIATHGLCQNNPQFDSLLRKQLSVESPGGTAIVAKDGKIIYRKAFGKANLEVNADMDPGYVFRVGSITKQFTALAILKLAEQGKLSLADTVTQFIPDFPMQGFAITIEHLLTHTSGIKNLTGLGSFTAQAQRTDHSPAELVNLFKNEPLDFPPGTNFRYSNSGYILLGLIIEKVSGKKYADYISENFLQPLNMKNSSIDNSSTIISGRVSGYSKRNAVFSNTGYLSMTIPYAAGSLLTNVDDLLVWYEALASRKLLSEASLQKAQTSHQLGDGRQTGYGFGWETGNVQGSPAIKHAGRINGFVTYAVYLPVEKIFVAIFSNCDCTDNLEIPASKMAAIAMDKPYQYTRVDVTPKELEGYQGIYKSGNEEKKVSLEDGRLLYCNRGGTKSELIPIGKDKFFLENTLTTLEFARHANGQIVSTHVSSLGLPVTLTRTKEEIKRLAVVNVDDKTLSKYVGNYQFSPGPLFSIVKEGGKLYGQVGQDKKEILPYDRNKFFAREIDAMIIFNLDKNGNVVSLTKIQGGEMVAKRID
ncbi:serine hydrolase [Flavihumibacter solisilvae]|uniref:Beta-lactamase-related domain-containing protein n=1 Tax=Flavihumibacter solisilvae TaxID=1349421 RepID=A0A0C1IYC0_9BACT|nr:serine hydrolase [Flavihumibacter solisilvae]KIC95479.1 hypothetical protein OI18_06265 [Flavihumibacter solisilvae]